MGYAKTIIAGNVGDAPNVGEKNGTKWARFSVAINWKDKDGVNHTDWHNITAFGQLADVVTKYVRKGRAVLCDCNISAKDEMIGETKRKNISFILNTIKFLGAQRKTEDSKEEPSGSTDTPESNDDGEVF